MDIFSDFFKPFTLVQNGSKTTNTDLLLGGSGPLAPYHFQCRLSSESFLTVFCLFLTLTELGKKGLNTVFFEIKRQICPLRSLEMSTGKLAAFIFPRVQNPVRYPTSPHFFSLYSQKRFFLKLSGYF